MAKMGNPTKKADGQILYAADLNNNLDLIQGTINTNDNEAIAHKDAVILDHPDASVTTVKIADANVTTAKIADANVTTTKIANLNVTTAKLADLGVTTGKIAEANVTTTKLADSSVTNAKLGANSVTTAKIADANVTTSKIADLNVTTDKIADLAVTNTKIASGTITQDKLVAGTLDNRYYTEPEVDNKLANIAGGQSYSIRTGATFPAVTSGDATPFVFYLTADQTLNGRTYKAKRFYIWKDTQWIEVPDAEMVNIQTATIQRGLQKIYSDQSTPAHLKKLLGRTLVNHMGRQGDFVSQFNRWDANLTIDTSYSIFGTSSGKIDNSAGTAAKFARNAQKQYLSGKRVLFGFWAKAASGTPTINVHLQEFDGADAQLSASSLGATTIDATRKFYYKKFDFTAKTGVYWTPRLDVTSFGTANDVVNFDGMVVYELTSAEFSKAYTQAEIEAKYGYINSVQHTQNPYFIAYGKNLLPPFTEWTLHANAEVVSPYELKLVATANFQYSTYTFDVIAGQDYYVSGTTNNVDAGFQVLFKDANGTTLTSPSRYGTSIGFLATAPTNAVTATLQTINRVTGTLTFTNPMLNLGSTALPFEPANNDYGYIEAKLGSNLDGTVYDTLYYDEGLRKVKRFELDKVLDGTLGWSFESDHVGVKQVKVANLLKGRIIQDDGGGYVNLSRFKCVKYDGKMIPLVNTTDDGIIIYLDNHPTASLQGSVKISVKDTDTGWGDAYTAVTADEIKAYFNGWKADAVDAGGKPTSWVSVVDGTQPSTDSLAYVSANKAPNYTPYSLSYQLANEKDEPVSGEFALNFHDGDNQVEFGEGVIVREVANPQEGTGGNIGKYYLNTNGSFADHPDTHLKNRAKKIMSIYKNREPDLSNKWTIVFGNSYGHGEVYAYIAEADFDPTAQYTVTYLLLDKHEHTVNVVESELSYNTNLKTAFDRLVQDATDTQAEVDAIQWDIENRLLKGEGERVESGANNAVVATAGVAVTKSITFKKSFSEIPKVLLTITDVSAGEAGYILTRAINVTTTGFDARVNSYTAQTVNFVYEATGK
jgi:hypothetical protein